jgi:hypothetical protein
VEASTLQQYLGGESDAMMPMHLYHSMIDICLGSSQALHHKSNENSTRKNIQ